MPDNLLTPENEAKNGKPEGLPDKFWDEATQQVRVDALTASYVALEKKMSQMLPVPQNDDERKRVYKAMGVPDTADQYEITLPNDFLSIDPELNQRLHAKGFTGEQVQEVYSLAAERMVPLILEMAAEFQADREVERLVHEFGGLDRWKEVSRQLLAYGKKTLPPEVLDGMACSYEGVMSLYKMMKGNEPGFKVKTERAEDSSEADLMAMMKNPKYWREKDPAFIAKVTAGFEKLYAK
jgi:hypothetical protein